MIKVNRLRFAYPDHTLALDDVSIEIGDGEFVAFVGQNGSGKTTLCKCFNGLLVPTSGTVTVAGIDTRTKHVIKRLAKTVGYVFQNPDHQLFNQTVWNEIAYGPENLGLPREEVERAVVEAAKAARVDPKLFEKHPHFLPKGLRQRVAIASVLAMSPQVVIVDEPTTGQDMRQTFEVMETLMRLRDAEKRTIIIITHEMRIVARYARRTVVLSRGRILADGETRQILSDPDLLNKSYVEPPQITRLGQALAHHGLPRDAMSVSELSDAVERLIVP